MASARDINIKLSSTNVCGLCTSVDMVQKPAVKFCTTCSDWLCAECVHVHKKFLQLKSHTLQDESSPETVSSAFCTSHAGMLLMFFCTECNVCICPLCGIDDGSHKDHTCITIDERAKDARKSIQKAISKRESDKQAAELCIKSLNTEYSTACKNLEKLEEEIKMVFQAVRAVHQKKKDDVEKQLLDEVDSIVKDINDWKTYNDDPKAAITVRDLSKLTSVPEQELPKLPTFHDGIHAEITAVLQHASFSPVEVVNELIKQGVSHTEIISHLKTRNIDPEGLSGEQLARLMKPGVRVRRGRDWPSKYNHQDKNGPGTVDYDLESGKLIWVKWDPGHRNTYQMGDIGRYELTLVV